jgi:UDP-glucose 4-epimerase
VLVADPGRLIRALGWKPQYTDLKKIVATAWEFEKGRA